MSDVSRIDRICEQVADRARVNWDAIEPAKPSSQLAADEVEQIELLRLLDQIGLVHADLQSAALEAPGSGTSDRIEAKPDDETLTTWGRYRLEQKVGRGGFGSVYRAWDPVLEMTVAIKILHRRFTAEHLRERLIREGRALAQVSHPNVVRVLNVEQNDDRLGLVMEFLRGETLEARVASQGVMNEREASLVGEDVCRALAAVHSVKLVHRDVKARNIIRDRSGRIVLMDFGAGSWTGQSADNAAAEGTPLYMAPEVMAGDQATERSDVYSVGVLLFFLVTNRYPFEARTVDGIRAAHASGNAQSLLAIRADLPLSFTTVVERALAHNPQDRYATPGGLLQALVATRDEGMNWKRFLARGLAATFLTIVLLTLAGMLSAASFNATLKRSDYVSESVLDWLELGIRSMVLPLLLSLLCVGAVGVIWALRSVLLAGSPRLKAIDADLVRRCRLVGTGLALHDPQVAPCWLLLVTAMGAAAVWAYGAPLLQAMSSDIGTASESTLSLLAPSHGPYRIRYRMGVSIVVAFSVVGWYGLARATSARGTKLPMWLVAAEFASLVLLCGSMLITYRLSRPFTSFPIVTWASERCYILGERGDNMLLFCPKLHPRDRRVRRADEQFETFSDNKSGESVFHFFGPPES